MRVAVVDGQLVFTYPDEPKRADKKDDDGTAPKEPELVETR